jgi:monoterpene epsilon-lactone hydrolase
VAVPDTVSPEWQERLRSMPDPSRGPPFPAPGDFAGWSVLQRAQDAQRLPAAEAAVTRYQPTIVARELGGAPVLDITPQGWQESSKVLVYTHGGNYTFFAGRSTLNSSVPIADLTGLRVISVDYTLAPIGKWDRVTDQVVAVLEALQGEGHQPQDIAIYGDSAGGALAVSAVLKLRDRGLPMPAAVVT